MDPELQIYAFIIQKDTVFITTHTNEWRKQIF